MKKGLWRLDAGPWWRRRCLPPRPYRSGERRRTAPAPPGTPDFRAGGRTREMYSPPARKTRSPINGVAIMGGLQTATWSPDEEAVK
ncbi:MAG: hypothetical protein N3A38_11125 [Planctomycetota bacterium]|nr:hypothetical protein [Planctomycetota bacterium]